MTNLEEPPKPVSDLTAQTSLLAQQVREECAAFRADIGEYGASLSRLMNELHEDLVARLALLQETLTAKRDRRKRRR